MVLDALPGRLRAVPGPEAPGRRPAGPLEGASGGPPNLSGTFHPYRGHRGGVQCFRSAAGWSPDVSLSPWP
jgi:hypothetical protein